MVSPKPFSPTPTSSAMKTPENTAENPDDPEQADEGDTQMEYYYDQLYNPNIGAVTKKIACKNSFECRYCPIIQHLSRPVAGLSACCCKIQYTERHSNKIIHANFLSLMVQNLK
jgi:hypothetical protein